MWGDVIERIQEGIYDIEGPSIILMRKDLILEI